MRKPTAPVKTFYFGMNEDDVMNHSSGGSEDNPEVDRFAASIQRRVPPPATNLPSHLPRPTTSPSDSLSSGANAEEVSNPYLYKCFLKVGSILIFFLSQFRMWTYNCGGRFNVTSNSLSLCEEWG